MRTPLGARPEAPVIQSLKQVLCPHTQKQAPDAPDSRLNKAAKLR